MIFDNPPDKLLRSADLIALFDHNVPGWHEVLLDGTQDARLSPKDFLVVDIPVDSTDAEQVRHWRERIANVRK